MLTYAEGLPMVTHSVVSSHVQNSQAHTWTHEFEKVSSANHFYSTLRSIRIECEIKNIFRVNFIRIFMASKRLRAEKP